MGTDLNQVGADLDAYNQMLKLQRRRALMRQIMGVLMLVAMGGMLWASVYVSQWVICGAVATAGRYDPASPWVGKIAVVSGVVAWAITSLTLLAASILEAALQAVKPKG